MSAGADSSTSDAHMADIDRIAPPVPTLPPPVGRNVGSGRRQRPPLQPPARRTPDDDGGHPQPDQPPEHIDEYV
jgi:hypothetical protein